MSLQVFAQAPATGSLPALPESDAILYINARRIINEALPRVLSAAQFAKVKTELDEVKRKTGIDISGFESGVLALRFGKPITATPDFVFVTRGTFNADALVSLARIGLQGKIREEKYGSKSINIVKLSDVMGATGAKAVPGGLDEVAGTALDGNTLALGTISFLKATIDAQAGEKVINPALAALAMRDTSALISLAINIPPGAFNSLIPAGMQGNEEIGKLIAGIENFSLSLGMGATDFPLQAAVRTASAEHAHTLSGILEMGIRAAGSSMKDKKSQAMLDALKITDEGSSVRVVIAIPQETVATLLRDAGALNPTAAEQKTDQPKKPVAKAKRATQRKTTRAKKP
jgi:hypothetical protein